MMQKKEGTIQVLEEAKEMGGVKIRRKEDIGSADRFDDKSAQKYFLFAPVFVVQQKVRSSAECEEGKKGIRVEKLNRREMELGNVAGSAGALQMDP